MNMVALVGNVASKPEIKQSSGGKTLCTFRLAVSRVGTNEADFLTVVAWERQAEICAEFLPLGRRIGVEGRLRSTAWKTEEGEPRSRVEIVANRVELMNKSQRQRPDASDELQVVAEADGQSQVPDFVDPTQTEPADPFAPAPSAAPQFAGV